MRYLSLFTGIGGFELGINAAYERHYQRLQNLLRADQPEHERPNPASLGQRRLDAQREAERLGNPLCVGYSEIDRFAIQIYQKNFDKHKNYGDITKINASELPDFDFLCGGFPCQSFSIAGKRGGFSDTRGTLFFEIARLLKQKQPRLVLLENVKGLLSHEGGATFRTIITTLDELGYDCEWQVLNSKDFGVPQNRERVFIVGHLRGTPRPEVFPFGAGEEQHTHEANEQGCASTLTGRNAGGANRRGNYVVGTLRTFKDGQGLREVKSKISPTLQSRARNDGSGQPVVMTGTPRYENGKRKVEYRESEMVPTIRATHYKSGDNQPVILARNQRNEVRTMDVSGALTKDRSGKQINAVLTSDMQIRRLTPVECERLQGFPDNWTQYGFAQSAHELVKHTNTLQGLEISDTQRYKTLGNAVTVNVIAAIMERILFNY